MHGRTLVCDSCLVEFKGEGYPYAGIGVDSEILYKALRSGWKAIKCPEGATTMHYCDSCAIEHTLPA